LRVCLANARPLCARDHNRSQAVSCALNVAARG
jgi:hypothetical protein